MSELTGDDLLWNWTRWVWSGATVGNMEAYIPLEDDPRPINYSHAMAVEQMHAALPWHERMVIIAEYPQKNSMFAGLDARTRGDRARAWIADTTGVAMTEPQYRIYLGLFRNQVERRLA